MIANTLSLQNFGIIEKSDLQFQRGFNVLSGPIGQGKSHVLHAISHLLIDDKQKRLDNFVRWGEDSYSCRGDFSYNNHTFHIDIAYDKKNGSSRSLTIDNTDIYKGKDVLEALATYFDPPLVRAAVVNYQGVADVIESTESNRRENLKRIYDLDFSSSISQLEGETSELKKQLEGLDEKIVVLKNKEYDFKKLERLPLSPQAFQEAKDRISELDQYVHTIEQRQTDYDYTVKQLDEERGNAQSIEDSLTSLDEKYKETEKELHSLQDELSKKNYDAALDKLRRDYDSIDAGSKEEEFVSKREALDFPTVPEPVGDDELSEARKTLSNTQADLRDKERVLKACENGVCPTCGKDFDAADQEEHKGEVEQLQAEVNAAQQKVEELETRQKEYNDTLAKYNEVKHQYDLLTQSIESERERIETAKQSLEERIESEKGAIEERKEHDKQQVKYLQKELTRIETDIEAKREEKEKVNTKIVELENKVSGGRPQVDTGITEERDSLHNKVDKYNSAVERNKIAREHNDKLEQQKKDDEEKLEELRGERDGLTEDIEVLETSREILRKEFPNFVIAQTVRDLESLMNNFLSRAYPRYTVTLQDGKNGLSILYGPDNADVSRASGGEKDIFNLALKTAFSRLSGLRMLLLDEVDKFHDLTTAATEFRLIHDMVSAGDLDQVFVVTHKDDIKDVLEADYGAKVFELESGVIN